MKQRLEITTQGTAPNGEPIQMFRIPNNTNDYIEISSLGCVIQSIYIHDRNGDMQNMLPKGQCARICLSSGPRTISLDQKLWTLKDIGENFVLLSCTVSPSESGYGCEITVGIKLMWVNLNRLVLDIYAAAENTVPLNFQCNFPFELLDSDSASYQLRTFCPLMPLSDGSLSAVSETIYGDLAFQPFRQAVTFVSTGDDVKPMAELACPEAAITLSAYSNMSSVQAVPVEGKNAVELNFTMQADTVLHAGDSLAARVIYGFDRLYTPEELLHPAPSPFGMFCL